MSADWVKIGDGGLAAAINPLGAELSSLTDAAGREWMTDADPAYWSGRAPLLFPIVGALNGGRYAHDGVDYALPQHGFARRRMFDLVERAADAVRFTLRDDAETRAVYPFTFTLEAAFRVVEGTLSVTCSVTNCSAAPMPASFGYHPAFAWPLPGAADKAGHSIVFDAVEPGLLTRLENGLIVGEDRPSPLAADGRTLSIDDALFADDALIWTRLASRGVCYAGPSGEQLRVAFPDAPALGIWSKPGAAFVCIEPWWGHADPIGCTGELRDKPGILLISPGETREFGMELTPKLSQNG